MKGAVKRAAPWAVLALGAVFCAVGILRGEAGVVLKKAILICMECIGIG